MDSKYNVCSKMWTDLNINFQKQTFQHCCKQTAQPISFEEIDTLKERVFDFHEQNILNRKISLDDNQLPPNCQWCIDTAPDNIKKVWNIWDDQYITNVKPQLKTISRTSYIDLDIGNSCDLACIYCGPWSSTMWAKELGQPVKNTIDQNWKQQILENLKNYIGGFDKDRKLIFNLLGGEPLLITDTYDIISYLSQICGHFENKPVLMITTNLNCKPALLKKLLLTINATKDIFEWNLSVSIEDIHERAEAVRYHLDFHTFENNLRAVKSQVDHLYITTTFSLFSFSNFDEFLLWCFDILGKDDYTKTWNFSLNNVQNGFTDLSYCPTKLVDIKKIKQVFNDIINTVDGVNKFKVKQVHQHLDNMYQRTGTCVPDSQFFSYWKAMSQRRKIDYFSFYPLSEITEK